MKGALVTGALVESTLDVKVEALAPMSDALTIGTPAGGASEYADAETTKTASCNEDAAVASRGECVAAEACGWDVTGGGLDATDEVDGGCCAGVQDDGVWGAGGEFACGCGTQKDGVPGVAGNLSLPHPLG